MKKLIKKNYKNMKRTKITSYFVIKTVCNYYNVELEDVTMRSRNGKKVQARQMCMYMLRKHIYRESSIKFDFLSPISYDDIGKLLGGRNHSTCIHGVKSIEDYLSYDKITIMDADVINSIIDSKFERINITKYIINNIKYVSKVTGKDPIKIMEKLNEYSW